MKHYVKKGKPQNFYPLYLYDSQEISNIRKISYIA